MADRLAYNPPPGKPGCEGCRIRVEEGGAEDELDCPLCQYIRGTAEGMLRSARPTGRTPTTELDAALQDQSPADAMIDEFIDAARDAARTPPPTTDLDVALAHATLDERIDSWGRGLRALLRHESDRVTRMERDAERRLLRIEALEAAAPGDG